MTKVVREPSPEVEITRVVPKVTLDKRYPQWANKVAFKGEIIAHPNTRRKCKQKHLAKGNSAAATADFAIDPEDYLNKPLVFDLKTTREGEVFVWLVTNMAVDNDVYYTQHEESFNVFTIKETTHKLK